MTQTRPDPAHTGFGDCACDDCYPVEAMAEPPVSAAVSPADTPESESQPDGLKSGGQISGRPVVSPADTIRRAHELLAQIAEWEARNAEREPSERLTSVVFGHKTVGPLVAALLAVGERDKAEIARLADRAVCSGCGHDVGESGICTYGNCDDGEMIPASDLPYALMAMCDSRAEEREEWRADWEQLRAEAKGLEAERERDRQQIAQLTEALERFLDGGSLSILGAVLAGEVGGPTPEEDAMGDHPDRPDFDPLAGEVKS